MNRFDRRSGPRLWLGALAALAALVGGCLTPSAHTTSRNFGLRGDVPVDPPRAESACQCDDCATGGRLFQLYCGSCHNARPVGERPFSNYEVAIAHMRDQAYLTGKEYRQIIQFFRRWHDVGPATPGVAPSPKRLVFSQPIAELKKESTPAEPAFPPQPPAAMGPWQQPAASGSPTSPTSELPPLPRPDIPAPIR
jgi:hypothetical protein